jgi:rod shape-determining protein MreB
MPAPGLVVHPLEMTEGGLSEIESRLLKELAIGCGAADAVVVTGPELTDQQVKDKFERK